MKLHHYLWAVAAACMLLPGCSNEDLVGSCGRPRIHPRKQRSGNSLHRPFG